MDNNELFALFWKGLFITISVITVTIGGCCANTQQLVSKDLASGVDPLALACAHGYDSSGSSCLILSNNQSKK